MNKRVVWKCLVVAMGNAFSNVKETKSLDEVNFANARMCSITKRGREDKQQKKEQQMNSVPKSRKRKEASVLPSPTSTKPRIV
jgi:hypothetical protein